MRACAFMRGVSIGTSTILIPYTHMRVHTYAHTYIHTCIHTRTRSRRTHVYIMKHATFTRIHTHIHAHTCTHTTCTHVCIMKHGTYGRDLQSYTCIVSISETTSRWLNAIVFPVASDHSCAKYARS
jgi:hypothetical protein